MAAISINLLPQELEDTRKNKEKQLRAIQISIGILILVIGIATFVLIVRVSQNVTLSDLKKQDSNLTDKITTIENQKKDGLIRALKQRIDAISQIDKKETPGTFAYGLIVKITPADIIYDSIALDKKSNIVLTGHTLNLAALEELFNNITDKNITEGKITGANIDSLGKDTKGGYKFELTLTLVGAPAKKGSS